MAYSLPAATGQLAHLCDHQGLTERPRSLTPGLARSTPRRLAISKRNSTKVQSASGESGTFGQEGGGSGKDVIEAACSST